MIASSPHHSKYQVRGEKGKAAGGLIRRKKAAGAGFE
jgi:hypothetical protein